MYNLSVNNDKTIKITLGQERMSTLQSALADSTRDSFVLEQGYATSMNLGTMANNNAGNRTFTINGKDGEYYNGIQAVHPTQESDYLPSGVIVTDGETLNIKDVAYFSNFRKKDPNNKGNGAAIEAYNADISITNPNNPNKTEFKGNTLTYAKRGGGAIYIEGGNGKSTVSTNSLTIDKAVFKNNYSGNYGGAIYAENIKDIKITNTDFINNKATDGGSIYIKSRTNSNNAEDAVNVNIENVTFNNNGSRTDLEISITDMKKHMSTVNIKDAEFTGKTGGAWSESLKIGADEYRYNIKSAT
jgi:predicted outer membrane repeat protein